MFKFRLALALGRTVGELDATLGSGELTEWKAFYAMEPFGAFRDNLHAGVVAAAIVNVNRARRGDKVYGPSDFLLRTEEEQRKEMTRRTLGALMAMAVPADKR